MRKTFFCLLAFSICLVLNASVYAGNRQSHTHDEFDALRIKWKNILTGAGAISSDKHIAAKKSAISSEAQLQWSKLNKVEGRTHLWDDLTSSKISAEITYAYRRIYSMALAYSTEGSSLKGNQTLRDDIIAALIWMNENRYVKMYNDWWDFQIGAPLELNNCITLMYDDLSETQRIALNERLSNLTGNPTTDSGANRAWRAFVYALNGIFKKDPSKIEIAKNSLSAIFEYVEKGEGFFKDGSFVQHADHPYNLGYGVDAIAKVSDLMVLLNKSKWEVTDPNSRYLYAWISDSFEPFIYKGVAMDMVRGREMARHYKQDYVSGFLMIGNIAKIAQFAPQPHASAFESMVKYWLVSNKQRDYFAYAVENASLNTLLQVKNIFKNPAVKPKAELIQYRQYARMDRALKLGPGYAFGISMHSTRVANFEADIKSENIKGWHTGSGMTYLYNADLNQYSNDFWPTVDNFRLSGTTVLSATPIKNDIRSDRDWVGGVAIANSYGITGMDYHAIGYSLQAKKSWFMFDNEIVALGAGISSTDDKTVETIVENRKLNTKGNNKLTINGKAVTSALGWKTDAANKTSYAHLAGNVIGSDIGYFFPYGAKIKAIREARTANWKSVNANPATTDTINHTNNFLTLWFDHGTNPTSATYAYTLLPGFTPKQVSNYSAKPEIKILRNDSLVQAVKETGLKITGANFWTDTEQSVDVLSCDKKASVILKEGTIVLEVGISDPTQLNNGIITVTINKSANAVVSKDANVTVVQLQPSIIIKVDTRDVMGKTLNMKFSF